MTQRQFVDVGSRVVRKSDGATGRVVCRFGVRTGAAPTFTTILSIRLDDPQAKGGESDLDGDLSWFTTYYTVAQ